MLARDMSETSSKETELSAALRNMRFKTRPRLAWTDQGGGRTAIVEDRVVIGATSKSGIFLRDNTVSRLHAELDPREDGLWVRDLQSRNGTWIDGVRVTGREKEVVAGLAVQTTDPASRRGTSYTKLRSHWNRRPWWSSPGISTRTEKRVFALRPRRRRRQSCASRSTREALEELAGDDADTGRAARRAAG